MEVHPSGALLATGERASPVRRIRPISVVFQWFSLVSCRRRETGEPKSYNFLVWRHLWPQILSMFLVWRDPWPQTLKILMADGGFVVVASCDLFWRCAVPRSLLLLLGGSTGAGFAALGLALARCSVRCSSSFVCLPCDDVPRFRCVAKLVTHGDLLCDPPGDRR